jgi:hypothetical protein
MSSPGTPICRSLDLSVGFTGVFDFGEEVQGV